MEESFNQARQRLPSAFQHDGFLDITRPTTIFDQGSITGRNILPFVLDRESIDIDYEHELVEADKTMRGK